jgi:hypothetical protein
MKDVLGTQFTATRLRQPARFSIYDPRTVSYGQVEFGLMGIKLDLPATD